MLETESENLHGSCFSSKEIVLVQTKNLCRAPQTSWPRQTAARQSGSPSTARHAISIAFSIGVAAATEAVCRSELVACEVLSVHLRAQAAHCRLETADQNTTALHAPHVAQDTSYRPLYLCSDPQNILSAPTLPLASRGSSASSTKADGTMYCGSFARAAAARAILVCRLRRDVGNQRCGLRASVLQHHNGVLHAVGIAASTASTSPSSSLKPRSLTWLSARPTYLHMTTSFRSIPHDHLARITEYLEHVCMSLEAVQSAKPENTSASAETRPDLRLPSGIQATTSPVRYMRL